MGWHNGTAGDCSCCEGPSVHCPHCTNNKAPPAVTLTISGFVNGICDACGQLDGLYLLDGAAGYLYLQNYLVPGFCAWGFLSNAIFCIPSGGAPPPGMAKGPVQIRCNVGVGVNISDATKYRIVAELLDVYNPSAPGAYGWLWDKDCGIVKPNCMTWSAEVLTYLAGSSPICDAPATVNLSAA